MMRHARKKTLLNYQMAVFVARLLMTFIPTMQKLLERNTQLDHILIETSGLALPQPLLRAFKWPEIQTKVTVDGVITVVDGKAVTEGRFAHSIEAVDRQRKLDENLDHETPLSEAL